MSEKSVIAILGGTGDLGTGLARRWVQAGYQVIIGSRTQEKADAGNESAKQIIQSWADGEWFTSKPKLADKITVTVFKVSGETNTDDLSPAPDA